MSENFFVKKLHKTSKPIRLIWLHGWGVDHRTMLPLAGFFADDFENYLIDLPGFGKSSHPKKVYGSEDYAREISAWLKGLKSKKPTLIIGHSFGGQVALQIGKLFPNQVSGLVLIGSAGLKRKRSLWFKAKVIAFKITSKIAKFCLGKQLFDLLKRKMVKKVGSIDYRNADDIMREVLIRVVAEHLTSTASVIEVPTLLIYGAEDKQTPPYFGEKYHKLIKNSEFYKIPEFNHYTILIEGRYQVQNLINNFLERIKK